MGNTTPRVSDPTEKGGFAPAHTHGATAREREWSYMQEPPEANRHETLTGATPDGRAFTDAVDHTCGNWTSEAKGNATALRENTGANAQVGMSDRNGGGSGSWNSAHGTPGCSPQDLRPSPPLALYYS